MDRVLRAILRTELPFLIRKVFATSSPGETYLHKWHVDAIAHQLMRVQSGEGRRLLINQPPRSLKSICVSVAYVAWLLGHDPTRRVIVASYSGDFAAELHRQFRMVVGSEWYAALFPTLRWAKETGLELIALGHGKTHVRRSGDVLHPERESREALEAIKAEVGSLLFSAQYQQRPVPLEGNLIRRSWFLAYDKLPASPSRTKIVRSWDVAMMTGGQNDYSACTTWLTHKNDAYLLHVYRGRLEYPDLRRKVIALATEHRATPVLIQNAGPCMNLLQDLRAAMPQGMTRPIGVKPEGGKVDRLRAQAAKREAGYSYVVS